jgi:hypothetical protein
MSTKKSLGVLEEGKEAYDIRELTNQSFLHKTLHWGMTAGNLLQIHQNRGYKEREGPDKTDEG